MPLGIVLFSMLLALLIVAYISSTGGGMVSFTFAVAWIKATLTIDQRVRKKRKEEVRRSRYRHKKNRLIKCRYCHNPIRAERIHDHNKKCPKHPNVISKSKDTRKLPNKRNSPFD